MTVRLVKAVFDGYIKEYTQSFTAPVPLNKIDSPGPSNHSVLLTGATGSLGSHLVAHLAELPNVQTIICLNRRRSMEPELRQRQAMESRGIALGTSALSKLRVFETDTARLMLGMPSSDYENLVSTVTHIVHNAWPMSIKRPVKSFKSQFQVMENLIDLAREISWRRPTGSKVGSNLFHPSPPSDFTRCGVANSMFPRRG